jgi:muramoyltetrapeptide carboxypeptidase
MKQTIIIPPKLTKGNTIGLICPGGYMPLEKTLACTRTLEKWGYKVRIGATVGKQHHYFAGTDAERLHDFQQMIDDPTVHAVLCCRGGYGTSRWIDAVNWKRFKKNPKWIIGYSDVTVLHCHLLRQLKIASLHAPMAGAFAEAEAGDWYIKSLQRALTGKPANYSYTTRQAGRTGTAEGLLVGGNLSLLAHLTGTASQPYYRGSLLFIEDVGEYLYNIDRMLLQLARAGVFGQINGLIVGGFTELKDTTIPMGETIPEIVERYTAPYNYPVVFDFPVSHTAKNVALTVGAMHQLKAGPQKVTLKQLTT